MTQRAYIITGFACMAVYFLLNHRITSKSEPKRTPQKVKYDRFMQAIKTLSELHDINSLALVDGLYLELNRTLNKERERYPDLGIPFLRPSPKKFPIRKLTFDITRFRFRTWTNAEMIGYMLGDKSVEFKNDTKDARVREMLPGRIEYVTNNDTLCSSAADLNHVVTVYTAPKNFEERDAVRRTWGRGGLFHQHESRRVFLLGLPKDKATQDKILEESRLHGDIVQTNFIDSYKNLSLKGISQLQWVKEFCSNSNYLVKTDDDLYVDMFQIMKTMQALRPTVTSRFIVGELYANSGIFRNPRNKWYVRGDLLPGQRGYPPYYRGWTYVIPSTIYSELYTVAMATPVFFIDDVYISGMLTSQLPKFDYLEFKGRSAPGRFLPGHPRMARECHAWRMETLFCEHLLRIGKDDMILTGQTGYDRIIDELRCDPKRSIKHVPLVTKGSDGATRAPKSLPVDIWGRTNFTDITTANNQSHAAE